MVEPSLQGYRDAALYRVFAVFVISAYKPGRAYEGRGAPAHSSPNRLRVIDARDSRSGDRHSANRPIPDMCEPELDGSSKTTLLDYLFSCSDAAVSDGCPGRDNCLAQPDQSCTPHSTRMV